MLFSKRSVTCLLSVGVRPMFDDLFDFSEDEAGEWRYSINGKNGENMVTSEGYSRPEDAKRGAVDLLVRIQEALTDSLRRVAP